jgi:uncharacterized protein (DUF1800 family)
MAANPLRPLAKNAFDYWKALHLANRAGFGGTPGHVRTLANLGLEKAVDSFVDFEPERRTTEPWDASIRRPPTAEERAFAERARRSNDEVALARIQQDRNERDARDRTQMQAMRGWWIERLMTSPRPLEEKLTLFWHGHFASGERTVQDSYHMLRQNELFRSLAAGNFRQLALEIVHDPAMLKYLDNDENRRGRPNENLAREFMELFVLGEGNGYGEADIREGARALTGFTFRDDSFVFDTGEHDADQKTIFGRRGAWTGDDLVRLVFERDAASQFVCLKLYRFFVNDLPGAPSDEAKAVITAMGELLRQNKFELKPVLRALFRSEHFYAASNVASVIKSPIQLIVQAARSFGTPSRSFAALAAASALMGQELFQPPNVKGWEGGRAWINTSTLFIRQNLAVYLLTGRPPNGTGLPTDATRCDVTHLLSDLRSESEPAAEGDLPPETAARFLCRFALANRPHQDRVAGIADFLRSVASAPENDRLLGALTLITAMPEYQLC